MLNIDITGFDSNDRLTFRVNDHSGNGDGADAIKEKVHWKVDPHCGVEHIEKIEMKSKKEDSKTTDIFSLDPPKSQANKKHWKATINETARVGDVYNYNIYWVKTNSHIVHMHDPKISVRPGLVGPVPVLLIGIISSVVAFLTLELLAKKIR